MWYELQGRTMTQVLNSRVHCAGGAQHQAFPNAACASLRASRNPHLVLYASAPHAVPHIPVWLVYRACPAVSAATIDCSAPQYAAAVKRALATSTATRGVSQQHAAMDDKALHEEFRHRQHALPHPAKGLTSDLQDVDSIRIDPDRDRAILHFDVDCFYAQARLSAPAHPSTTPPRSPVHNNSPPQNHPAHSTRALVTTGIIISS